MVLNELLPMLSEQGLDTSRGIHGWSMGGYGASTPGRPPRSGSHRGDLRGEPGTVVVLGRDGARRIRDGADDYAANSVWGLPALASIPIRIDCGDSDPFYAATKALIAQLPNPPARRFSPGGHDSAFWSSQLPAEIAWMAPLLTA